MYDTAALHAEAADPYTPLSRLAELAEHYPFLQPTILANPSCYDGLAEWLRSQPGAAPAAARPVARTYGQPGAYGQSVGALSPQGAPQSYGTAAVAAPARARKAPLVAIIAGALAVVLVGGAAWAYFGIFAKLGGSASPVAAVEKLISSATTMDQLALLGSLSPAEVGGFAPALDSFGATTPEGGTSNDQLMAELMGELTITVDDVKLGSTEIDQGIALVTADSWNLNIDGDPEAVAALYFSSVEQSLRDSYSEYLSPEEVEEYLESTRVSMQEQLDDLLPLSYSASEYRDFAGRDIHIVAVQENGGWFVSPLLTGGQFAADAQGIELGKLVSPTSYATPEDATEGFVNGATSALSGGSTRELAASMPLAERRFLSLYGGLYEGVATSSISTGPVDVTAHVAGDSAQLDIESIVIDEYDRGGRYEIVGTCATAEFDGSRDQACLEDLPMYGALGAADIKVYAVKENGSWHVSPIRTAAEAATIIARKYAELSNAGRLDELYTSENY